ncbi:MAG: 30S ribosomal protein S12 methylthiotransferase RimO [Planctomycetes bacterium]|jgi:ribosomal protein S12 methylthiotransferase|nr:30S ribosomal protein S12 methylthiotransferase RimO [Planctomycetota bacterium]
MPKNNIREIRVALVHLGCARNLIDSENILGRLGEEGFALTGDVAVADVGILNTCSFIGPAREESESAIRDLLERKKSGTMRAVIVAGCLPEKFRDEIVGRFPEVDAFLGLSDYSNIARIVQEVLKGRKITEATGGRAPQRQGELLRLLQTPRSYAYLRPSHGCDHECAFCIIPDIRGKQASKPVATVVEEVKNLVGQGVCEIVMVAEDTTGYGVDGGAGAARLPELVESMAAVDDLKWLRVMYAYPNSFPWRLTEVMRESKTVVPYLDIPIQHISTRVLKRMKRGGSSDSVRKLLQRLRDEVPGITLRTTVLVGHPGEGEAEFEELLTFLAEFRFERLGAFPFSPESGTIAGADDDRCSPEEAQDRVRRVMEQQQGIHAACQQARVGTEFDVLVDGSDCDWALARSFAEAPEEDSLILVPDPEHRFSTGSMLRVEATEVTEDGYDLIAVPVIATTS